jgi:copper chaperone CopZ
MGIEGVHMQTQYVVSGITCQHCIDHVIEEITTLPGVQAVEVSLDGAMTITTEAPLPLAAVMDAVAEAGDYTVVPA